MDEQNLNEQELENPIAEEAPESPVSDMLPPEAPELPIPEIPAPEAADEAVPPAPRPRRRKSKQQVFKEQYLPFVILGLTGILCLTFIFGSMGLSRRASAKEQQERIDALLQAEVEDLKTRAAAMAAEYDYENAM